MVLYHLSEMMRHFIQELSSHLLLDHTIESLLVPEERYTGIIWWVAHWNVGSRGIDISV